MPGNHALLAPSSSERWINCPPSAKENAVQQDTSSSYAQQGTDAHALCEYKVKKALGHRVRDPTEDLTYFDEEMAECSDTYCEFVMEQVETAKQNCSDPLVLVEQRLDFTRWVAESFGTADCIIVADGMLTVIDFKYGLGILVEAEENPQMRMYALGALNLFESLYDIQTVRMIIFQPRRDNISIAEISKEELLEWAEKILVPAAALAANGEGEYKAGKHCQFCKVKATCRKRAEYNLQMAQYDFAVPDTLSDDEISMILNRADTFIGWVNDVKTYALEQAISGKEFPGYKIVEGRSNRRYTNDDAVAAVVTDAGYDPFEKKLMGVTAMTKLLGKKKFDTLLGSLIPIPINGKRGIPQQKILKSKGVFIMAKIMNPTKVVTGKNTRFSYLIVNEPKSINGGTPKYSVSLIIPKSDTVTIEKCKAAIKAAYDEGQSKLKGNGKSVPALKMLKTPLRDGDEERPDDPAYADSYFINANSATKPGVVDADCQPILDTSELYSGIYGRASINFYTFNTNGNRGIACGLNNLQKLRDGEPLGGKSRAEDDFADDDDDDFLS